MLTNVLDDGETRVEYQHHATSLQSTLCPVNMNYDRYTLIHTLVC